MQYVTRYQATRKRDSLWVPLALLLSATLVGTLAQPAAADVESKRVNTYYSSDNCQDTRSEVSHGNKGGGYLRVDSIASRYNRALGWACAETYERPAGYHAVKAKFYKWRYVNGEYKWDLCWSSDWTYNSTTESKFWAYKDFGSNPPCGSGYYKTYAGSYHKHGGEWWGGWVWSPSHYLPS